MIGPPETFGPGFPFVIVTPLTTTLRDSPSTLKSNRRRVTGSTRSATSGELVRSVNQARLVHGLGSVDAHTSQQVATVIKTLLNY